MSIKIIRATKFNILKNICSFSNICRNMYGEVIQTKYYEESSGVAYFLSQHPRYFLIFLIQTNTDGTLELSLIKTIVISENEFTWSKSEIVVTGTDRVFVRDDSNAHEIDFSSEITCNILREHSLPVKISTMQFILSLLHRQDLIRIDFVFVADTLNSAEHISLIESAFSTVLKFKDSIDAFGKRALFLAIFRYKLYETNAVIEHLRELSDYEILAAFKSDSQVKVS